MKKGVLRTELVIAYMDQRIEHMSSYNKDIRTSSIGEPKSILTKLETFTNVILKPGEYIMHHQWTLSPDNNAECFPKCMDVRYWQLEACCQELLDLIRQAV